MTVPNISPDAELAPSGARQPTVTERLLGELRVATPIVVVCLLLGLIMGLLWVWLAPEVPLVVHGQQVLYVDPEGEQRAGADGTFVLIGIAFGIVTALVAFLATRRRGGGVAVAVMLAVGGVAGSLIAWKLGTALGPTSDLVAHAKAVGDGHQFNEALELEAKAALLAWPMTALVLLLALTATFGKREQDPPPYWAGPAGAPPAEGWGRPPAQDPGQDGEPAPAPAPGSAAGGQAPEERSAG